MEALNNEKVGDIFEATLYLGASFPNEFGDYASIVDACCTDVETIADLAWAQQRLWCDSRTMAELLC